jgi:inorganic pyrophosphatase
MVDYWRDFPSGPDPPNEIHVVTEIIRGGRNKYEYDAKRGAFFLNRVLYTYYPCDYGFIPQTLDDDGDPLDVVLLINEHTFTGCVTVARPVANIRMWDDGLLDDKIVAISTTDPFYKHIESLSDIPRSMIDELNYFYTNYKRPENKETRVESWNDVKEAKKLIVSSQKKFWENYPKLKQ